MRIFIAGATGVIGRALVPRLVEAGHAITAMTRNEDRVQRLRSMGVETVVCDVYDRDRLASVVAAANPQVLVHELTALPPAIDPRKLEVDLAENDRIRTEGTRNLMKAAEQAGVRKVVAQSISFAYVPDNGRLMTEESPLWLDAPWPWKRSVEAVADLERQVLSVDGVDGVVLRYGYLYGAGTAFARDGAMAQMVKKRQYPVAGGGNGVFSFVYLEDAARATVTAIEVGSPGIYNVVDDEPAALKDWLPVYAQALDAPAPRKVPAFIARMIAGNHALYLMTRQSGASNAKAKRQLDWRPRLASYRTGFEEALASEAYVEEGIRGVNVS